MNATEFNRLCVPPTMGLGQALERMDESRQGILLVVAADQVLLRTVTDGDLRRAVLGQAALTTPLSELPARAPITARIGDALGAIQSLMDAQRIDHVPVLDGLGRVFDVVFLRELTQRIHLSSPHLGEEETAFVEEAFRTNWIAPLGPHVDAFERELAAQVGVAHAAALSSGTAAIHLGLILLGVEKGDAVFCSSLTFVGSCNPILYCGARPVFIDSEPQTWNMSPPALERALEVAASQGRLPKAVIIVNLYGQSADMAQLLPLCERYGVAVLEDAAESLGASYHGRASGSFGRVGVFSFNGNKIITTSGGGMLVSDDEALVQRARKLATQARESAGHYEHVQMGFNYRLSNVLAGIGRGQLRVLAQRVERRREVFQSYRDAFAGLDGLSWMPEPQGSRSTRWLSCLTLDPACARRSAEQVLQSLARHNIEARPVWKPMHRQPLFAQAEYFPHAPQTSVSDQLYATGLCLPSGSNMDAAQQGRVIDALCQCLLNGS